MTFHRSDDDYDGQYMKKLKSFLDFIFKINYSNQIYVNLEMFSKEEAASQFKYKIHIGKGNNSLLLKSLIKRRFWWEIVDTPLDSALTEGKNINFFWSQNIINEVHN